eukprot:5473895-Prymnesium_polylepis.1
MPRTDDSTMRRPSGRMPSASEATFSVVSPRNSAASPAERTTIAARLIGREMSLRVACDGSSPLLLSPLWSPATASLS